jgi:hypothetical protein
MLTAANVIADGAGPTVSLAIRYLKPTLIAEPAVFEAWVTSLDRRRTHSRGQLVQNGWSPSRRSASSSTWRRSRINAMHRRDGRSDTPTPRPSELTGNDGGNR